MDQVFSSISAAIAGLEKNNVADKALVFAAWGRCAGDLLRARTHPLEFAENRLVIAVEDELQRKHLTELAPHMLARVNAIVGSGRVRFIEFRIDPLSVQRSDLRKKDIAGTSAFEPSPSLEAAAASISDKHLRQTFLEAAAGCLDAKNKDHGR